jgi:hypothetical protein
MIPWWTRTPVAKWWCSIATGVQKRTNGYWLNATDIISSIATRYKLYFSNSFATLPSEPALWTLLKFRVPTSIFHLPKPFGICPSPRSCAYNFVTSWYFYGEKLLTPGPTTKLKNYPSSAVCDCLINIFTSGGRLLHLQPEDAPCSGDRDSLCVHKVKYRKSNRRASPTDYQHWLPPKSNTCQTTSQPNRINVHVKVKSYYRGQSLNSGHVSCS